jgi:hypothetical protein
MWNWFRKGFVVRLVVAVAVSMTEFVVAVVAAEFDDT